MTNDIIVYQDSNAELETLSGKIRELFTEFDRAARTTARIACDLGGVLIAAREIVLNGKKRGNWMTWFQSQNYPFSYSSAGNFMLVAERYRGRLAEIERVPLSMLYQLPPGAVAELPEVILNRVESGDLSVKAAVELVKQINRAAPDVAETVLRYEVSDPEVVPLMQQVKEHDPDLFQEWSATGAIDNGETSLPLKGINSRDLIDAVQKFRWYMGPKGGKLWDGLGLVVSADIGRLLISGVDSDALKHLRNTHVHIYLYAVEKQQ